VIDLPILPLKRKFGKAKEFDGWFFQGFLLFFFVA
jgi:hypothetical protein